MLHQTELFEIETKIAPNLPNFLPSDVHLVLCGDVEGSVCWCCVVATLPVVLFLGSASSTASLASPVSAALLLFGVDMMQVYDWCCDVADFVVIVLHFVVSFFVVGLF